MDLQNPFRHYPRYRLHVCTKDGGQFNKRGTNQRVISIPVEEEDVLALTLTALTDSSMEAGSRMWVDGIWAKYSEAEFEKLVNSLEDEPEDESEDESEDVTYGPDIRIDGEEDVASDYDVEPIALDRYGEVDDEDEAEDE